MQQHVSHAFFLNCFALIVIYSGAGLNAGRSSLDDLFSGRTCEKALTSVLFDLRDLARKVKSKASREAMRHIYFRIGISLYADGGYYTRFVKARRSQAPLRVGTTTSCDCSRRQRAQGRPEGKHAGFTSPHGPKHIRVSSGVYGGMHCIA